jgi:hypothetical protein
LLFQVDAMMDEERKGDAAMAGEGKDGGVEEVSGVGASSGAKEDGVSGVGVEEGEAMGGGGVQGENQ